MLQFRASPGNPRQETKGRLFLEHFMVIARSAACRAQPGILFRCIEAGLRPVGWPRAPVAALETALETNRTREAAAFPV
jgi:hypothetical protein